MFSCCVLLFFFFPDSLASDQRAVWFLQLERLYHQRVLDNLNALQEQWGKTTRSSHTKPFLIVFCCYNHTFKCMYWVCCYKWLNVIFFIACIVKLLRRNNHLLLLSSVKVILFRSIGFIIYYFIISVIIKIKIK